MIYWELGKWRKMGEEVEGGGGGGVGRQRIKRPDVDKFPVIVLGRSFVLVGRFSYLGSLLSLSRLSLSCGPADRSISI